MILSTEKLTWNAKGKTFSAEASDFSSIDTSLFENVGGADIGVRVRSSKTGKIARFFINHREDSEGDLVAWHLLPVPEDLGFMPELRGVSLVIFND